MHGWHVDCGIAEFRSHEHIAPVAATPSVSSSLGRLLRDTGNAPYPPPSARTQTADGVSSSLASATTFDFGLGPSHRAPLLEWSPFFAHQNDLAPQRSGIDCVRRMAALRALRLCQKPVRTILRPWNRDLLLPVANRWSPRKRKALGPAHPLGRGLFSSPPFLPPTRQNLPTACKMGVAQTPGIAGFTRWHAPCIA